MIQAVIQRFSDASDTVLQFNCQFARFAVNLTAKINYVEKTKQKTVVFLNVFTI